MKLHFLTSYPIWCRYLNPQPRYAPKTKFNTATTDDLFLLPVLITRPSPGTNVIIIVIIRAEIKVISLLSQNAALQTSHVCSHSNSDNWRSHLSRAQSSLKDARNSSIFLSPERNVRFNSFGRRWQSIPSSCSGHGKMLDHQV